MIYYTIIIGVFPVLLLLTGGNGLFSGIRYTQKYIERWQDGTQTAAGGSRNGCRLHAGDVFGFRAAKNCRSSVLPSDHFNSKGIIVPKWQKN